MVVNFSKEHVEASKFAGIIGKSNAAGFDAKQYMHLVVAGYCKIIYRLTHAGTLAPTPTTPLQRPRAPAHALTLAPHYHRYQG